jgi:hypothetical protein
LTGICTRRLLLLLSGLVLAALSCGLPGNAGPAPTAGPPATPAIFLPTEWTPTPAPPTPEVPPGWEEFHAGRVHLWLPGSFEGGDMGAKFEAILDTVKSLGPEFAQTAQMIEQNPDKFVVWAFDTQRGPSGYVTTTNVTKEDVPSDISIEDYLEASLNAMPEQIKLVDQAVVSLKAFDAGKLVLSSDVQGLRGLSVVYAIRDGDRFWKVTYATGADEFVDRTPTWEQSIRTFRLGD